MRFRLRPLPAALAVALAGTVFAACAGSGGDPSTEDAETASIVVSYSVLGSLVGELVGDAAGVSVLMPDGIDPHDWQPSARDIEAVNNADLVVVNGLGLEEGLDGALEEAQRDGVRVFEATNHVDVRRSGESELSNGQSEEHGAGDPHIWTDPLAMKAVMSALATTLERELGLDLSDQAAVLERRLDELDAELGRTLSSIPPNSRKLVAGHESMGYFADRYGLELVGALVPGLSSQAVASAGELAALADRIEAVSAPAIFIEVGLPKQIAEAVGDEAGVTVIELPSHALPDDGSYFTFMREMTATISKALDS